MAQEHATIEDRRFIFVTDVDGKETPVFLGSIVRAIRTGAVPGFEALNKQETETVEEILADAEHHHRARLNASEWEREVVIERKFHNLRVRLGLSLHHETPEHCPYLKMPVLAERFGL